MLFNSTQILTFLSTPYDYLIIGGGTAGLVLADRLSTDPSILVGVLEAGYLNTSNPLIYIPGLYGQATGTSLDWNFTSTPQPRLNNRTITFQRGKTLGGSSALNFLVWNVGSAPEYDSWGYGWNWETISQGWRKAEGVGLPMLENQLEILPDPPVNLEFHGTRGPVGVSFPRWFANITERFIPALEKAGGGFNMDAMGGDNTGGYYSLSSIDPEKVERSSSASAYLLPNLERENLRVLAGVTVTKVVLKGKVARGVEFVDKEGKKHQVMLKPGKLSEVILAAGSIQSPQLLELSGIGGKKILEAAGIPVVVRNDHVGENLQEHPLFPTTHELVPGIFTRDWLQSDPALAAAARAEYDANRTGVLTSTTTVLAMLPLASFMDKEELENLIQKYGSEEAFKKFALPRTANDTSVAQVELIFAPYKLTQPRPEPKKGYFSLVIGLMHPLSQGSIHISSADPLKYPVIEPRFFEEELDRTVMLAAAAFAGKIAQQEPLKSVLARRLDPFPEAENEHWSFLANGVDSIKHPIATCALGKVVDGELRVLGASGLRVVDASIIPHHVSAHTQVTVYGIAERAAELIIAGRKRRG